MSQLHLYLYSLLRPDEMKLVDSGPYGLVRHPMYTALMLAFWITPTMVGVQGTYQVPATGSVGTLHVAKH